MSKVLQHRLCCVPEPLLLCSPMTSSPIRLHNCISGHTHEALTSGSIAQLNVFSFLSHGGLCGVQPKPSRADPRPACAAAKPQVPLPLAGHIRRRTQRANGAHIGQQRGEWWMSRETEEEATEEGGGENKLLGLTVTSEVSQSSQSTPSDTYTIRYPPKTHNLFPLVGNTTNN